MTKNASNPSTNQCQQEPNPLNTDQCELWREFPPHVRAAVIGFAKEIGSFDKAMELAKLLYAAFARPPI